MPVDCEYWLKSLSDKSREAKVKSKKRTVQYLPKFSAGLELLSRYEDTWAALHKRTKECASAGERVDTEVVMLSVHWEKKRTSLIELQEQLQQIPGLLADLESMTANLRRNLKPSKPRRCTPEGLHGDWRFVLAISALLLTCSLFAAMSSPGAMENSQKNPSELDAEHTQKVLDMEHSQQLKLKERQKFFEEAFQQDMEQYLSTGYLQIAERREPIGSMSSMEVNVDMLEQMDLMDMSDQEALDVFLNSGEGNALSPGLGPDASTCQNEISLEVPNHSASQSKPSSLSSVCTDSVTQENSESGESPVVQSDEEEVQVDTALATIKARSDVSDESDS
ncbi:dysbindin isoform X2 [Notamacropus eugenii]|uniref:dysbindin isoform X2 n=1 Tax=Notamacropus eugenii TaxID=9315 RepID=UPI003B675D1A